MTIFALEFSSEQRSVALARDGRVLGEAVETGGRGTRAFSLIEKILVEANVAREEIELMAVGLGPGSYAGIRAAVAVAQGWQLARGTKLIGVGSVEGIAAQAQAEEVFGRVNVVIDAQRGDFYLATWEISATERREINALRIVPLAAVRSLANAGEILAGPGVTNWFPSGRLVFPRAATLAGLAAGRNDFVAGETLEPVYLRETNYVKAAPIRILPGG
jgi:tRNA threonylcarbamoyladenosine biosynthesis protein TsaB